MEKRIFLAIFLSFLILTIYQAYFTPTPPTTPPTADATAAPAATSPAESATPAPVSGAPKTTAPPTASPAPAAPVAPMPATVVGDTAARDIDVDTTFVHAVFSTEGATLKSWRLKRYFEDGAPLDLVPADLPPTADVTVGSEHRTIPLVRPFTLSTTDAALTSELDHALYQPSVPALSLGDKAGTLTFEYRDASGLNVRKTFHFQPDGKPYELSVDVTVDRNGTSQPVTVDWGPALGLGYKPDGSRAVPIRALLFRNGKVERVSASKLDSTPDYQGQFRYAGVEEQYFLSTVLPGDRPIDVAYQPVTLPVPNDTQKRTRSLIAYRVQLPGSGSLSFFFGPKDLDVLRAVDPELVRAIDFGFFSWLVVPLLQALKWINGYLGNYGWSIVVLTALINLAIFPLRHRSMVSMRKMQAVQPEVKAIQDRYAKYKITDPERQKMNQEMMALYKQKGVNPASGCLPMLLTFPILFAFYALLGSAIELRGAPFFGWIQDLSLRDPLYITPVLMGVTMLIQQRMMPTTADPMQQKIFLIMPVFFTVTFLWVPAGLVVYWLMSNIMAIGQQYVTNRMIGVPVKPAAASPRKKSGGGAMKS
jgi:YidC/Oxa1 family membrane protein insertase